MQSGPMSPRTTQDFNEVPHSTGDATFQSDDSNNVYPEPLPFLSNDWIDWNLVFPPGPTLQVDSLNMGVPSQQSSSRGLSDRVVSY